MGGSVKHQRSLTEGSVIKTLLRFTAPVLLALLLQSMYGAVDLMIVGKFGEVADVSAVTIGSQVMQLLTSFCTGLAMGSTILLGQKIGQGEKHEAGVVVGNTVTGFLALAVVLTGLFLVGNHQIVAWMNTPKLSVEPARQYIFYCGIGIVMIFAYNVLGSIFRGIGDSRTPLVAVAIACVVNIVGDLILVAGFGMGAAGAAIATVVAQGVSVVASILMIMRKQLSFSFRPADLRPRAAYIGRISVLGIPIALESILVSLSFLLITVIVNEFGVVASAAVGVSEKLSGFIMLVPLAFMQSLSAYVAQNYGAGKLRRCTQSLKSSLIISVAFGVCTALLTFFHGDLLAGLFSDKADVIAAARQYLKAYAFDCALVPTLFCMIGLLNGFGKTTFVMIQGVFGALAIRVPLAFLISRETSSLFLIGLATPMGSFVQIVMILVYYAIVIKSIRRQFAESMPQP